MLPLSGLLSEFQQQILLNVEEKRKLKAVEVTELRKKHIKKPKEKAEDAGKYFFLRNSVRARPNPSISTVSIGVDVFSFFFNLVEILFKLIYFNCGI